MKLILKTLTKRRISYSERQIEVIKLWAETDSSTEAAKKLGISEHTYLSHLKRLRKKIGVNRTFHVFYHMQQSGLLESRDATPKPNFIALDRPNSETERSTTTS